MEKFYYFKRRINLFFEIIALRGCVVALLVFIAVLAEYAIMNSELADAQREFEMCKNDCIARYGTN